MQQDCPKKTIGPQPFYIKKKPWNYSHLGFSHIHKLMQLMFTQDVLAKAKALEVQAQAATFTKLEHDLSEDAAALRAWVRKRGCRPWMPWS